MTPSPASAPRIAYLESIRGLAAVQVVLLHFFGAFMPDLVFDPTNHGLAWYIHLSPLAFLYDGHSAVYLFFVLSGYVLTRSFERHLAHPIALVAGRIVRLGLPALAAVTVAAVAMIMFGKPNAAAGALTGSGWFASPRLAEPGLLAMLRDGVVNALVIGYSGVPGVPFLAPWQQSLDQSFAPPLWTLSIELYGSLGVLVLCWSARRSRALWWTVAILATLYTARSAYLCFVVGHLLARGHRAERPAPASPVLPVLAAVFGILLCVRAEVWQPEWLTAVCNDPTWALFPGQTAARQQKAIGAILLLAGLIHWQPARALLSRSWLVRLSRLSFPVYLVHWPILFGPAALIFLGLHATAGLEVARWGALVAGIALAFGAGLLFLPVDGGALALSRALRKRLSGMTTEPTSSPPIHPRVVVAE